MKTKLVLALSLSFVTMCSFMCSKDESLSARESTDYNTTIDMSQFPDRTIFVINSETKSASWRFDSDSLKMYNLNIPEDDTYFISWRLVNVRTDLSSKAFVRYGQSNLNMEYEKNNSTVQTHWKIKGTYLFTKERK